MIPVWLFIVVVIWLGIIILKQAKQIARLKRRLRDPLTTEDEELLEDDG